MIDIFVTIKPTEKRFQTTLESLRSLEKCTDKEDYRLTICFDGRPTELYEEIIRNQIDHDYLITSNQNDGLGPTINRALSHIQTTNEWWEHPTHGNHTNISNLIVMCQDDLLYTKDWLKKLSQKFYQLESSCKLGFATGLECVEHKIRTKLPDGSLLKDWIRAAQIMGRREYWMSMFPIPRFDPETGRVRAKPNDGIGSGVDWHFIRNHENSVCRTGRTCLVMPGLVQHLGFDKSTWLDRELPESDEDKRIIKS